MFKNILLILVNLFFISMFSQNVDVVGTATGRDDKLVRVIVYSDQFSLLENTIAESRTNISGEFTLNFNVNQTTFAYLAIGLEKGEFYLTSGAKYNFSIPLDTTLGKGSIFDKLPLNFSVEADDGGVQKGIGDFNVKYNEFIYNNVNSIYKYRDKSVVVQFVDDMSKEYIVDSSYVSNYVKYSLASLLWLSKKENNEQILDNYIVNKPVLYNNIQYTEFFKDFFSSYFDTEKLFSYSELILAINNNDANIFTKLISRNEQFAHDGRVSEIVEMLLLSRNYHNRDIEKNQVISKLRKILSTSKYAENRTIAKDFILTLTAMQSGSKAPNLTLYNSDDDTISLEKYKGKFILLDFVKENCKICNFQMKRLNELKNINNDKFEIITIVAGDNINSITNYIKQNRFTWPVFKTGNRVLGLEKYNVITYPSYVFINPDGTIAYANLPMPEENMQLYLTRFMDKYNTKIK